ncbi:hypothetical protein B0H67DRAFT_126000 [Lasiosphaeris hirsuta]|uniref:DUF6546 domain-containing protein n=1 Tax=Lasiosphaeris hirsuta TaxID=260670 RepID=A0AA40B0A2_9PEZI|nr:hypothetical protein B0H67DRAFT_126000 [Lasiosphaeris hirsuta]
MDSPTKTNPTNWHDLPTELRLMIFEAFIDDCKTTEPPFGRLDGPKANTAIKTATYASVNREWQAFFEARHFWHIVLTPERLLEFGNIVQGSRRRLVGHIQLRVHLAFLDCPICVLTGCAADHEKILAGATRTLFNSLATWDKSTDRNRRGLGLELTLQAPRFTDQELEEHRRTGNHKDCTNQREFIRFRLESRATWTRLELAPILSDLPKVHVVTEFFLQHPDSSRVDIDGTKKLLQSLPSLKEVVYEPPRFMNLETRNDGIGLLSESFLPRTLRGLEMHAEHNTFLADTLAPPKRACTALGRASRHLQKLRHLHLTFIIDATTFFQPLIPHLELEPSGSWDRLETLSLTAHKLTLWEWDGMNLDRLAHAHDLLESAAVATRLMPKLRTMCLWAGKESITCFCYTREDDMLARRCCVTIVMRTRHRKFEWELRVVEAWKQTAIQQATGHFATEPCYQVEFKAQSKVMKANR